MKWHLCLVAIIVLALTHNAYALRCKGKLISTGDSRSKVLNRCGEPEFTSTRTIYRTLSATAFNRRQQNATAALTGQTTEAIDIEQWEYNFGSRRLSRKIIFENGRVVKIKKLGYGD